MIIQCKGAYHPWIASIECFDPETIALIGASEKEGSLGRTIIENMLFCRERKIFPVNPNRKTVLDRTCYASITDVPGHIDLAIIVTAAKTVPRIVEECGQAGVDGLIIISEGFREVGEEGWKLEEEIVQIRKKYGMRILGPNCLGVIRPNAGFCATHLSRCSRSREGRFADAEQRLR